MSKTTATKLRCRDCIGSMTWAASRVQYGRALRRGLTAVEAKAAQPRCQKCMTKYLRAIRDNAVITRLSNVLEDPILAADREMDQARHDAMTAILALRGFDAEALL